MKIKKYIIKMQNKKKQLKVSKLYIYIYIISKLKEGSNLDQMTPRKQLQEARKRRGKKRKLKKSIVILQLQTSPSHDHKRSPRASILVRKKGSQPCGYIYQCLLPLHFMLLSPLPLMVTC